MYKGFLNTRKEPGELRCLVGKQWEVEARFLCFKRLVRAAKAPGCLCGWAGLGCRSLVRCCAGCSAEARVCCLRDYCGYGCGHIVGRNSYDGHGCLGYGGSAYTLLPTTVGLTVVAELTELGVNAAATVKKKVEHRP